MKQDGWKKQSIETTPSDWQPDQRDAIREALLHWFEGNKRRLPWREERSPYRTWISEIMLQQTQVEAVRPHFERFMERFPTLHDLAVAAESDVLQNWAGLGYYSRARSLHRAAQIIEQEHGGRVPSTVGELLALPGIGRYTAGAIASIAYDIPAPILDGNVMRVLSRVLELRGDPRIGETNRRLWTAAEELVAGPHPGAINEGLMELGAVICIPGAPRCKACPLSNRCLARIHGVQDQLPERLPAPPLERRVHVAIVFRHGEAVFLQHLVDARIWKGLWVFPTDFPTAPHPAGPEAAAHPLLNHLGVDAGELRPFALIRHGVMNWSITLKVYDILLAERQASLLSERDNTAWVPIQNLNDLALPSPHRKIARLLVTNQDQLALF